MREPIKSQVNQVNQIDVNDQLGNEGRAVLVC